MTSAHPEQPTVLVVGGAGFVGRNLVEHLARSTDGRILVVDNFLSSDPSPVLDLPQVDLIEGSIADDTVLNALPDQLELVFHLATYHGNQSSIHDPLADHENNTLTTLKLFDRLARRKRQPRVVYASAGCTVAEKTYGEARPTTEDDPVSLRLDSPYQISKLVGEMYANYYHARHDLPVVIARFQNVFGPGEVLGAGRWRGTPETVWRNVVPVFVYRALTGAPLRLENGGETTRDFIFVDDVVRGLMRCAEAGRSGEAYNLATGREVSILELATAINKHLDPPAPLELAPARDWDRSGRRFGSTVKAARELGFEAEVAFEDGIATTVQWTRRSCDLITSSIGRHRSKLRSLTQA